MTLVVNLQSYNDITWKAIGVCLVKVAMVLIHAINESIVHRVVHTLYCLIRHLVEALHGIAIDRCLHRGSYCN